MSETIPKVAVDIWSDIVCPWCAIGYTQFRKALDQLDGEVEVEVRFMPFELNPQMEPEGAEQTALLAQRYGRSEAEVLAMRATIEEVGDKVGFSFAWDGDGDPPPPWVWNTFEAHKLLRWALTTQGLEAQSALKLALFRGHFQQRRMIGKREVLLDIAENLGFDRRAAQEALEDEALSIATRIEEKRGLEAGINSVPNFVVNGRYLIPGAHEPQAYADMIRKVVAMGEGGPAGGVANA